MNSKTYKILKIILETPNEWHSTTSLAYDVDMTTRQVVAIIGAYEHLPLEKDRDSQNNRTYVMFQGTKEEASAILTRITEEYYGISEEMKKTIYDTLSPVAWMTVTDIVEDTNFKRCDVSRTLGLLEGVATKTSGEAVMYRRESTRNRYINEV